MRFGGGPKVGTLSRRVGAGEVFIKKDLCTYLPLDVRDTVTPFIIISTRVLPISPNIISLHFVTLIVDIEM